MTKKLSTPFAINSTLRNDVPVNATNDQTSKGIVGYNNGWTSINKLPLENGGQPPYMEDLNGVLFDITGNIVDINKGLPQYYDDAFATLIGGYPIGARLVLNNNSTTVISTIANNQNNPNTNMSGWITLANLEFKRPISVVDSIADLQNIQSPYDGQTVFVKSYYTGKSKGANIRVYDSTLASQNDNVTIINGWVMQLDSHNTINAYQAGAYGDGTTDDQPYIERCLQAIYKLGFGEVQLTNGKFLVNRQMASSYNKSYPSIIELASNMNFMVDKTATLIIGSAFDYNQSNSLHLIVFGLHSDANKTWNGSNQTEATAVDNVSIYGGGTIDFTQSGNMGSTSYQTRYGILLVRNSNILIDGLTFVGNATNGDLSNAVGNLTNKIYGDSVVVSNCKFINLVCNSTINTDHSTLYSLATNSICKHNYFFSDQATCPKMSLIGSMWEAHNSGHKLYNNTVIGYKNSLIVAFESREHYDLSAEKGSVHFYDNDIHTMCHFVQFDIAVDFTNVKPILIHDNNFTSCRYLTSSEQGMTWYNKQLSRFWFNFYNSNAQSDRASTQLISIHDNTIVEDPTNYDYSFSSDFSKDSSAAMLGFGDNTYVPNNLSFSSNKLIRVFKIADFTRLNTSRDIVYNFSFIESKIDSTLFPTTTTPINFNCRYSVNNHIDITFNNAEMYKLAYNIPFLDVGFIWADAGTSNTFILHINRGLNGIFFPMSFSETQVGRQNKFSYPAYMTITATTVSSDMKLVRYDNTKKSNVNYNSYVAGMTEASIEYNVGDDLKAGLMTPYLFRSSNDGGLSALGLCATPPSSSTQYDIVMQLTNNNA